MNPVPIVQNWLKNGNSWLLNPGRKGRDKGLLDISTLKYASHSGRNPFTGRRTNGIEYWKRIGETSKLYPGKDEVSLLQNMQLHIIARDWAGDVKGIYTLPIQDLGTGSREKIEPFLTLGDRQIVVVDRLEEQLIKITQSLKEVERETTRRHCIIAINDPDIFRKKGSYVEGPSLVLCTGMTVCNITASHYAQRAPLNLIKQRIQNLYDKSNGGYVIFTFNRSLNPNKNKAAYEEVQNFILNFMDWMVAEHGFPEDIRKCFRYTALTSLWPDHPRTPVMSMVSHTAQVTRDIDFRWKGKRFSLQKDTILLIENSAQVGIEAVKKICKKINAGIVFIEAPANSLQTGILLDCGKDASGREPYLYMTPLDRNAIKQRCADMPLLAAAQN
ncbi:MAG: L-histidine N(alpha)-methyltransferase [Alphaproteobacteria bacterium]|nr:L-histidine N(alpha)-methyltransferase [Alphaproteobacteria bacterium]